MSHFKLLLRGLSQLIYPNLCWACQTLIGEAGGLFCGECLPKIVTDPFPTCPRCSSSVGPHTVVANGCPTCADQSFVFDGAFRMAPYDGLLRELILRMKAWSGEDLAEALAVVWAERMAAQVRPLGADAVIPIPLHWKRRWMRGFNQSDTLARALAQRLGIACLSGALHRTRSTPLQSAQGSATSRRENVKGAFALASGVDITGKIVLLVDDILTTGATASEASRALRVRKPKSIHAVVLAHGN